MTKSSGQEVWGSRVVLSHATKAPPPRLHVAHVHYFKTPRNSSRWPLSTSSSLHLESEAK